MNKNFLQLSLNSLNRFLFKKSDTQALGIFRILFGIYLLITTVSGYPNWEQLYGIDGILSSSFIENNPSVIQLTNYPLSIFFFFQNQTSLLIIFSLSILANIMYLIGFRTKLASILLLLIFASRSNYYFATTNSYSAIVNLYLFCSCFAHLGGSFSIDSLLNKNRKDQIHSIFGLRMFQVSIIIMYFFIGLTKLLCPYWRSGLAIYYISLWEGTFRLHNIEIIHNLIFSKIATYTALTVELSTPFLLCIKATRLPVIIILIFFHSMIGFAFYSEAIMFDLAVLLSLALFIHRKEYKVLYIHLNKILTRILFKPSLRQ